MPIRRPSASAGHAVNAHNGPRQHRSNDSHHGFMSTGPSQQPPSVAYSSPNATPQQKIVQALINRIKNKLPCNSGTSLDIVESDAATQSAVEALVDLASDSLDVISFSLGEILDKLAKQVNDIGHMTIEVLQSQLFVLKILSMAMSARSSRYEEQASTMRAGRGNVAPSSSTLVDSSAPTLANKRSRQASTEFSAITPPPWADEPSALDDQCAKYILSVMVLYLRQTATPESRLMSSSNLAPDASLHDFESVDFPTHQTFFDDPRDSNTPFPGNVADAGETPPSLLKMKHSSASFKSSGSATSGMSWARGRPIQYEKTHMSLIKSVYSLNFLIAKYAGRTVFHLSGSNWHIVFDRIRNKIRFLANTSEDNPDTIDLRIMTHSKMDRSRLSQVLHELSSLLVNMKREAQAAVAIPLRMAIWNWIDIFPDEFNETIRTRGRLDGAPERVFDLLHSALEPGRERTLWPTLTILACLSSDRLTSDYQDVFAKPPSKYRKEVKWADELRRHGLGATKYSDVAFVCGIDICRAGFRVSPDGEIPLRMLAGDIAHDIKHGLLNTNRQLAFWDVLQEVDVATYAEALAIVFRFLPQEDSIPIFEACLGPDRSDAVKICAIKGMTMLATEVSFFIFTRSVTLHLSARLCSLPLQYAVTRRMEIDEKGIIKVTPNRPMAKRFTNETLPISDLLILSIVTLWRADLSFYVTHIDDADVDAWVPTLVNIWSADLDVAVKVSAITFYLYLTDIFFRMRKEEMYYTDIETWLKSSTIVTLVTVSKVLLQTRMDVEQQRLWISVMTQVITVYLRKSENDHASGIQLTQDRVYAFAMAEIAFLVSLTSASSDVTQLAAQGLRMIAQAERQPGAPVNNGFTEEDRSRRLPIYEQLGDPHIVIVGAVREQKRVRKLMRLVAYSSPINVAVWQECFLRWQALSEHVAQGPLAEGTNYDDAHLSPQERAMTKEWRNLTHFLAAFGGACVADNLETVSLTAVIPGTYLPDEMRALRNPIDLVTIFLEFLVNALIDDTVRVRDAAREALGTELSPRLYGRLLKQLNDITVNIANGAALEYKQEYGLFLDQLIQVLKSLVENLQSSAEENLSIDLGSILHVLAGFISRFREPHTYRIRIRFCQLCDSIASRTDILNWRKDDMSRNHLLEIIMDWFQEFTFLVDPERIKTQCDLNYACLSTSVKLLERLKLYPLENQMLNETDDAGHVLSRIYTRYTNILGRALDICHQREDTGADSSSDLGSFRRTTTNQREIDIRNMVITGLSNVISANSEVALRTSIPVTYSPDLRQRTIYMHAFARVLGQGTTLEQPSNAELQVKRNRLTELVKGSDMILAMVICECCPAAEVDVMISVLMNLFDTRSSLMVLLKTMIDREIEHTPNEGDLFRGNSTYTRFLSAFAKLHGYNYLRSLVIPLVKSMSTMPEGHGYELDPNKIGREKAEQNLKNVELVASSFLEIIVSSVPTLPPMIREVCAHLSKVQRSTSLSYLSIRYQIWPEAKFAALGAFLFLRFISPAIVSPETVDVEVPNDDGGVIRRGLMVIAKVIQNLANNIFFAKEQYMKGLNSFLSNNITNITRFLSEVNKYSAIIDEEPTEWLGTTSDDTDTTVLHRFLDKHTDKIGKELLSYVKPGSENDSASVSAKLAWENLCALLVELQEVPEIPRLSMLPASSHREYLEMMNRCANRNVDSVRDIFVEASVENPAPAVFVLYVYKIDVEALDIELLMFYILDILTSPAMEDRYYEIVLDCTSFSATAEVPSQWLKFCTEIIPVDVRQQLSCMYFLNANALTLKYLRRIYNVSSGLSFPLLNNGIQTCSSVKDLLNYIPESCLGVLQRTNAMEAETRQMFPEMTMRQVHDVRMPVILEVAETHVRITSVRGAAISTALTCKSTEVIPVSEISDTYNVSTGQDPFEFIIRRGKQGATSYFSSPSRDLVVKAIRAAKSQLRDNRNAVPDHNPRFHNFSATLLHVGMLNIDADDEELRTAAHELLGSVCQYVDFDKTPLVLSKAGIFSGDTTTATVNLSKNIAQNVPKLTLDFISVVMLGMPKCSIAQKTNFILFISPWMKNISLFCNPAHQLYDYSGNRMRDCIRSLIDLTVGDQEISAVVHQYIWGEIGKLDASAVHTVLEELIRAASDAGVDSPRCEILARTTSALSSIHVRGRIFSKLRKVLGKTTLKPSRTLPENMHWNEIATLARFSLISITTYRHDQLYVPDICHVATLIAATGPTIVRKSIYGLVFNFLQSLCFERLEDPSYPDLRALLDDLTSEENLRLFGLMRPSPTSDYSSYEHQNVRECIKDQEALACLLTRFMEVTSQSRGLLNVWRARWMSLATSTAFQLSASIQSRAFLAIGTLATSDVDDDLVYQMLVAFKNALGQSTETDTIPVVTMLRCLCKIVPGLNDNSTHLPQLFWLAVAFLQSGFMCFYAEAADLLHVTLQTLERHGMFEDDSLTTVLFEARQNLDEVAGQLDNVMRMAYDVNFSFYLASIVFKGIRHGQLKSHAESVLRTLLSATLRFPDQRMDNGNTATLPAEAIGYFIALLSCSTDREDYNKLLHDCNADRYMLHHNTIHEHSFVPYVAPELLPLSDPNTALFLAAFIGTMLATAQGDDAESEMLYKILLDLGVLYPDLVAMIYETLQDKIKDTLANSTHAAIIKTLSGIFRMAQYDSLSLGVIRGSSVSSLTTVDESSSSLLSKRLEEYQMEGLSTLLQFVPTTSSNWASITAWISELIVKIVGME
ncbi:hypothetical protein CONPUDRAFT_64047 [Coniophora puteana RWD-64-598 SS2]|uniref:Ras-GAP domain-containing protein n=1 Tax=Coniophora puteana (strain RWD-64-598) TaxID=741705 RepID=A0A5M3MAX4_CONPW|nr:uncharacterized protein CONPUDRAFT_64047 [Coniophora puteana RWD-64-598 SS2]EIW76207.1 hypothetical protein CONPUDRAFT_64047 [Coniophora puteana RWD-64-598 SS2]